MLGTSLYNMPAPAHGSKGSNRIIKARPLGAPHAKKKRRLNELDERRGRGGGANTQLQAPVAARHSQGQQEYPPRGRGGQKAQWATTVAFEEMISGEQGRGRASKDEDTGFGQQMHLRYDALDLFDYGDALPPPPSLPLLLACSKPLHLCSVILRMMFLVAPMRLWALCTKVRGP